MNICRRSRPISTTCAYLAGLTETDLAVELKKVAVAPDGGSPEDQYRMWLLTLNLPRVEAAALPASVFTLRALEAGKGILIPAPPHASQMLAWLAKWDYAGNPYFRSAVLKRRAFVLAAVDVMLLDYLYDHNPQGSDRADFLGGNLIWLGYTYQHVKDALPPRCGTAMEAGLKRLVLRLHKWGPRGAMTDMDLFAAVGLRYVAQGLGDPEVTKIAEAYAERLFTDPRLLPPSGILRGRGVLRHVLQRHQPVLRHVGRAGQRLAVCPRGRREGLPLARPFVAARAGWRRQRPQPHEFAHFGRSAARPVELPAPPLCGRDGHRRSAALAPCRPPVR